MKLLIITNMYPSKEKAYAGIFVKNQYEKIKKDIDTDILFMRRKVTSKIGSVVKYAGISVKFIPYLFRHYSVIHVHYYVPLILLAITYKFFRPRTKIIVTFHGSDIMRQLQNNSVFITIMKKTSRFVDIGIPVGKVIHDKAKKQLSIKRLDIIPVGVDDKVFYYQDTPKMYDFVFVGSFTNIKGIDILYNAISRSSPDIKYCLIGKGDDYEKQFRELSETKNIEILIDINQQAIAKMYNQSKFLILPSRSEGFSTVTIESMYCGTPVIGSNIPQIAEQIRVGKNGFLFDAEDSLSLLDMINKCHIIKNHEYKVLVDGALASFRDITLDRVCKKLVTIYTE